MADDTTDTPNSTTEATTTETTQTATDAAVDQVDVVGTDTDTDADADSSLMGDAGKAKDEGGEKDAQKDEPAALPEKYDLTPPEGLEINDEVLAEVDPVFRELNLSNEQANRVLSLAGPFAQRLEQAQTDAFMATATAWAKEAKNDPDIGRANWAETEGLVAKALDRFGAPEGSDFRKLLNDTKLGNHPEMIRMFRKIGEAMSEDTNFVRSDGAVQEKPDRLQALYPDDVPKAA